METRVIGVRLDLETIAQLERLAKGKGMTLPAYSKFMLTLELQTEIINKELSQLKIFPEKSKAKLSMVGRLMGRLQAISADLKQKEEVFSTLSKNVADTTDRLENESSELIGYAIAQSELLKQGVKKSSKNKGVTT